MLANITASQDVHKLYGGVVPELASRAHQQHIIPVVDAAIRNAGIEKREIQAVAFTLGPGLLGSLLVGTSFAKGFAMARQLPLIEVNHMQAHILAHFIPSVSGKIPRFPFLCLTVSGGHTQIVRVNSHFDMQIIGETLDDAAGEAFDKVAKILGLPYPGGPMVDRLAAAGNPAAFSFPSPQIPGLNYSFSGLKTAFLYFVQDKIRKNPGFIEENKTDICASIQTSIIKILLQKLRKASKESGITQIAIAGGVSANTGLRAELEKCRQELNWELFIPPLEYCTDNAAMIAMTGYFKYLQKDFSSLSVTPKARYSF